MLDFLICRVLSHYKRKHTYNFPLFLTDVTIFFYNILFN